MIMIIIILKIRFKIKFEKSKCLIEYNYIKIILF